MQDVDMVLNLHGEVPSDTSAVRLGLTSRLLIILKHGTEHSRYKCRADLFAPPKKTPCLLPAASYSPRARNDTGSSGSRQVPRIHCSMHHNRSPSRAHC